jgi:hypothetical protein
VADTKKSKQSQGLILVQHSEQGAVQDSIAIGEKLYPIKTGLKVASLVIERLCYEMMSGDKLFLAFHSAKARVKDVCPELTEEDAVDILNMLYSEAQKARTRNPISGMF